MHKADYADALPHLQTAITQASEVKVSAEAAVLLKQCLDALSQTSMSTSVKEQAAKAALALAKTYYGKEQYSKALPYLQTATALSADGNVLAEADLRTAGCLYWQGNDSGAITAAQAVPQITDQSSLFQAYQSDWCFRAMEWVGRAQIEEKQYTQAIQTCDSALATYTNVTEDRMRDMDLLKGRALALSGQLNQALSIAQNLRAQNISAEWNELMDGLVGGRSTLGKHTMRS